MKKLSFAVAVLLVFAIVACDTFNPPESAKPQVIVTEDGRVLVGITIGVVGSDGRALTDDLAEVATERYEVAFLDGSGEIYRTSWADGELGRLWVNTPYNYGGFARAILFAGSSNGTLLATGEIIRVDGILGTQINGDSRTVTFELTPLNNNVLHDPALSTFVIDYNGTKPVDPGSVEPGATEIEAAVPGGSISTWDTANPDDEWEPGKPSYEAMRITLLRQYYYDLLEFELSDDYDIEIGGIDYPVFWLPNSAAIDTTYAIDGVPAAGIVTSAAARVIPRILDVPGYRRVVDVKGTFMDSTYATPDFNAAGIPVIGVGAEGTATFNVQLTTEDNQGIIKIMFEIPVNAMSNAPQRTTLNTDELAPGTWYIRGGIINTSLDQGAAVNSDGGALIMGVGIFREDSTTGQIEVEGRY